MTPLFRAVMGEAPKMIDFLLEAKADPYVQMEDGRNVFEYAELMGAIDCLAHLQKAKKEQ